MNDTRSVRFAVDLFAFWNPRPWGLRHISEVAELGRRDPRTLWDRLLGQLSASGVASFEVTFAPFDGRTALAAYGGPDGLQSALDDHGLSICGGYLPLLEVAGGLDPERRAELLREVTEVSEFLAAFGGASLVGSLPLRRGRDAATPSPVDLAVVARDADALHEVGAAAHRAGIAFGLHTESHSRFWLERDIDLYMLATDPFYVGLCLDAGHVVLGGGDPVATARRHRNRLVAAHWKDAIGPMSWDLPLDDSIHIAHRQYCRVAGDGIVDWSGWSSVMADAGLTDPVLLEVDASPDPVADIRRAILALTPVLDARPDSQ